MFDYSVLSRCIILYMIYDPLLDRPFHKDFSGVCLIFGGCIPNK